MALQQGLNWVQKHSPEEIASIAQNFFPEQEEKTLLRGICRYKNLGCWSKNAFADRKGFTTSTATSLGSSRTHFPLTALRIIHPFTYPRI